MELILFHVEALVKELQDLLALSFEDYFLEQKNDPESRYSLGVIVGMGYACKRLLEFQADHKD
jgi:hypothetical protein